MSHDMLPLPVFPKIKFFRNFQNSKIFRFLDLTFWVDTKSVKIKKIGWLKKKLSRFKNIFLKFFENLKLFVIFGFVLSRRIYRYTGLVFWLGNKKVIAVLVMFWKFILISGRQTDGRRNTYIRKLPPMIISATPARYV